MVDGFKTSLSHANKLMWASITFSATLILLDPSELQIDLFGLSISTNRLVVVAPITSIAILIARQVVIRNAIYILENSSNKDPLKEIVSSYPLSEFMRWRLPFSFETTILTIFQTIAELLPATSFVIFSITFSIPFPIMYGVAIAIIIIGIFNYRTLRRNIFEPLLGPIVTPD